MRTRPVVAGRREPRGCGGGGGMVAGWGQQVAPLPHPPEDEAAAQ